MQNREENDSRVKGKMDKLAKDILQYAELTLKDTAKDGMWEIFRTHVLDKVNETRRTIEPTKYKYHYNFNLRKEK